VLHRRFVHLVAFGRRRRRRRVAADSADAAAAAAAGGRRVFRGNVAGAVLEMLILRLRTKWSSILIINIDFYHFQADGDRISTFFFKVKFLWMPEFGKS